MLVPYTLPHACETAEVAEVLAELTPKQRRVLREYAWKVMLLGEMSVTEWLRSDDCPVSPRSWYTCTDKANYWHSERFRAALAAYTRAGSKWQLTEEQQAIRAAQNILRMGAPKAARRLVRESEQAIIVADGIRASVAVLDRADVATAPKASEEIEVIDAKDRLARLLGSQTDADGDIEGTGGS